MKMKVKPAKMTTQTLLDFDLEESSSDSDFRIEDHDESEDDFSDNSNAEDSGKDDDATSDTSSDNSESDNSNLKSKYIKSLRNEKSGNTLQSILESAKFNLTQTIPTKPICCACLGDRSDDSNEIVECDGCGVSVHEGCYGVSDSTSISSTVSSCSTEPWFCDACRAGVIDPYCELCPNKGGIFKETDVGKWVHLICALYVPGVAFGEVDLLSSVTLFEMPYSKWGAKICSLCEDAKFARTGVCIGCDAGMCKSYFHVTCAQAAGFLSEAHSEEVEQADPFYAHCKIHSDKTMIKHRKRNYCTLKYKIEQRQIKLGNLTEKQTSDQLRIQRKLNKHKGKYKLNKLTKSDPWVPTQKMPRLLNTSATACRRLIHKADLMGIDTAALEFQEAQMAALADVRKKWHIPPAFSVEFIGYYLDRITRLNDLKSNLERHIGMNKTLIEEQQTQRDVYDKIMKVSTEVNSKITNFKDKIQKMHEVILLLCPNKTLPSIDNLGQQTLITQTQTAVPARPMSVPTAAALKMGVGFPLINLSGTKDDTGRILSTQRQSNDELVHECGICKRCNDQHMLAKCDTCHFYYHLGCLSPPLNRHPKKSKLYGWQCSECDKSDKSDGVTEFPKGPRKSRTKLTKDGIKVPIIPYGLENSKDEENTISKDNKPIIYKSSDGDNELDSSFETEYSKTDKTLLKKNKTSANNMNSNEINLNKKMSNKVLKKSTEKIELDNNEYNNTSLKTEKYNKNLDEYKADKPCIKALKASNTTNLVENEDTTNGQLTAAEPAIISNDTEMSDHTHKQNRKRRKEKHKNKYSSDNEKSPTKEHKRKRKKKSHDIENVISIPKIKIKFKTLPLPGEVAPEPHFIYVSADMVRPLDTSRPTSVETIEETTTNFEGGNQSFSPTERKNLSLSGTSIQSNDVNYVDPLLLVSENDKTLASRKLSKKGLSMLISPASVDKRNNSVPHLCDVCNQSGTIQNSVRCDECGKFYHFTCLDPPLKKTPKKRGYSWHCADCDPTDMEM